MTFRPPGFFVSTPPKHAAGSRDPLADLEPPKRLGLGLGLSYAWDRNSLAQRARLNMSTDDQQEKIAGSSCI